jgi:hypothetical protein
VEIVEVPYIVNGRIFVDSCKWNWSKPQTIDSATTKFFEGLQVESERLNMGLCVFVPQ